MIYLDNAATSFPKPAIVLDEVNYCLKKYCGNPGRSSHKLSQQSGEAVYTARERVASHLGLSEPESIIFTYNATYALNIAIKSLIKEGSHILTSDFEHNSVIRPLEALKKSRGIEYSSFSAGDDLIASLQSALRPNTKGIVCSIASNVTGEGLPLEVLSDFASKNSLLLIIDASQAVGHIPIDLSKTPCTALCAPGHKGLFGIQGSGFLYMNSKAAADSFIEGGSGSDSLSKDMPLLLPEKYEGGTLSTPAIVSLSAGIKYIDRVGVNNIKERLDRLTNRTRELLSEIKGIKLYRSGSGLISFNIDDIPSSLLAASLDDQGICVRGGLHCAPSAHKKLGTLKQGAVRVSFSYLNRDEDADKLYLAIKKIIV